MIDPEDNERGRLLRDECIQSRRPRFQYEARMKMPDGQEAWMLMQCKVIYDENGNAIKLYCTNLDITERKQAEEALRKSETLLRMVIEGTTDAVFLKDRNSNMLMCNSAVEKITGMTSAEMIGKDDYAFYADPEIARVVIENDRRVMDTDKTEAIEEYVETNEGSRTFLSTKTPLHDAQANVIGVIGIARDITDRKKMETDLRESTEELRRSGENKSAFISALSHELRNPLASIVTGITLLDMSDDKDQIATAKEIMKRQIDQLCRLVDDLLDVTRINNNKIELKKERVELNRLVAQSVEDYKAPFRAKGITIDKKLCPHELYLEADPARLIQCVGNLLSNAYKFTEKGGETRVSICEENNVALIKVEDNGIGIVPELLPFIFEPFKQADTSLDRPNGGLGLGLSIVKGVVELHGGTVCATSEGPGKGSSFTIRLPMAP